MMVRLIAVCCLVAIATAQLSFPMVDITFDCQNAKFAPANQGDPEGVYYHGSFQQSCRSGFVFSMKVCTCMPKSGVGLPKSRPYCDQLLALTGQDKLPVAYKDKHMTYNGDNSNVKIENQRTCFTGSDMQLDYTRANDLGDRMNFRFKFDMTWNLNNRDNRADALTLFTNGDCESLGQQPRFELKFAPASNTYTLNANGVANTCKTLNVNRGFVGTATIQEDVKIFYDNGNIIASFVGREGRCNMNFGQNVFVGFKVRLQPTKCPLKVGSMGAIGGVKGTVCYRDILLDRDCTQTIPLITNQ